MLSSWGGRREEQSHEAAERQERTITEGFFLVTAKSLFRTEDVDTRNYLVKYDETLHE